MNKRGNKLQLYRYVTWNKQYIIIITNLLHSYDILRNPIIRFYVGIEIKLLDCTYVRRILDIVDTYV